jgi:hypothetical protein
MQVQVKVSRLNLKYLEFSRPKGVRLIRSDEIGMMFLAQLKFRGGESERNMKAKHNLVYTYIIRVPDKTWYNQCIKKDPQHVAIAAFNRHVRNKFYQEFFIYMDLKLLKKELQKRYETLIKDFAFQFMAKLNLSDDDILLETLLRNYRRYRTNPDLDLYELIDSLSDDDSDD